MKLYYERMIKEKEDLVSKINKATSAVNNNDLHLTEDQKSLLKEQITAMNNYADILGKRILYEKLHGAE